MKNYEKPEISITSYEATDSLMAMTTMSSAQNGDSVQNIAFNTIEFKDIDL